MSTPRAGVGWGSVLALGIAALVLGAAAAVGVVLATGGPPRAAPGPDAPVGASEDEGAVAGPGYAVWAVDADGDPVRWDPCTPVRIVVSGTDAPGTYPVDDLLADVESAVATLREATGLDLVVDGTTTQAPAADRPTTVTTDAGTRRWAPVLVGWRAPGTGGLPLRDVDRAIAVPIAVGPADARSYVTGQVALNPDRTELVPGTEDRATSWGATVLHELAHVLGLAHVDDPDELMYVYPGDGPVELGPGDRAGLAAVGAGGGCLDVPAPTELEVDLPSP